MLVKRLIPGVLIALALTLAGCSSNTSTETPTPEPVTSTTTAETSSTTATTTATSTAEHSSETTTEQAVAVNTPEPTVDYVAPTEESSIYVVECLFGTPGPALWSDGSTAHSEDCYQQGIEGRGDYQCPATDAFVFDPADCTSANLGGDPSYDEMYPGGYPASQVPYADGGTCPAYLCGYGTDENGNRNPSSGEIQGHHGCQLGTITDPEYCARVAEIVER